MKRNMDLFRSILLEVEKAPFDGRWHNVEIAGHSADEISYHVKLLSQAGLIEAIDLSTSDGICWAPKDLTNDGHEFLDSARNDTVWAKAKDKVTKGAGVLTLEALKAALSIIVHQAMTGGM
jgi:hypothetical protein